MKILIIVPDGVGVRNYLFSNFTSKLIFENNEVFIYHNLSNSAIDEIKRNKPELLNFIKIPFFVEPPKTRLLRETLAYARLLRNKKTLNNKTILNFWMPSKKGFKKKILYFIAEKLGFLLSNFEKLIFYFDKVYEKEILKHKNTEINKNTLLEIAPDFILNLHQRSPLASPIIAAAKKLNVKTATVIFSWDNVPKARLVFRYDYYFVWSDLMRNQLKLLYKEISSSKILVTGTPQFEFYFNKNNYLAKEIFFNKYGLDPNKKTICFSGNDPSSPYEANYLNDICEEVTKIEEGIRPQIIFRKCPVDKTNRFDKVLENYKNLIFSIDPDWKTEKEDKDSFTSIYPTMNDNVLLVNTIKYSDLIINLGSTMAHDAAVLNKPSLYLNYNPVKNSTFNVEDVFNFEHFKSLKDIEAVGWINNKDEIKNKILNGLQKPNKLGKDRKEWLNRIVLHPLENNSEILKNTILKCI